jgi:cell division protein FtsB
VTAMLRLKQQLVPQLTALHEQQARLVAEVAELQSRLSNRRCVAAVCRGSGL